MWINRVKYEYLKSHITTLFNKKMKLVIAEGDLRRRNIELEAENRRLIESRDAFYEILETEDYFIYRFVKGFDAKGKKGTDIAPDRPVSMFSSVKFIKDHSYGDNHD